MKKLLEINPYILIGGTFLALYLTYASFYYNTKEIITITVKDKERITTGSGKHISSKFLIYTENEVFQNTDNWIFLKFDSADFQNTLTIGETYNVEVAGWRIPFLSFYRNITKIKNQKQ